MGTVTKRALIERIARQTGQTRAEVKRTIQGLLEFMMAELAAGRRLEFRDFGVFEVRTRAARTAQNPKTLERVSVPPKRTVRFKVGQTFGRRLQASLAAPGQEPEAHAARGSRRLVGAGAHPADA